ncbi:hypothetical protein A6A04_00895 [Paramagnetospirillum marisnigri]|uniref:Periplasmic heavy metal sensor n=1 Tax=Paramagnetospirillum marisnigri TaxID=1285242 RepID=A0A178MUG9_9PROT|nr:periplasmic heavy metal sensor [Paramagnetospirillum marisnigri]OAN52283.1 hypothetical protein A6A04_00895 [Paramagnetospirillum marisnigri]
MDLTLIRRWSLPLSLALNVFLATVIALHPRPPHRPGPPPPPIEIARQIAASLPPADGAILLEVFAAHAETFQRSHDIQHEAPERIKAALAAREFSADALRAAFDVNRAGRQLIDEALAATLIETASRMSPEGRAKLAQWRPPGPPGGGPPPPR